MNKYPKIHIYVTALATLLIIGVSIYASIRLKQKPRLDTVTVQKSDVTQGVNTDGTVGAAQDLKLAFEQGGTVSQINVNAGDKVKKGQNLVELDSKGLSASLNQAQASVQGAEAAYEKLLNGATDQDLKVLQVALASAKTSLDNTIKQQQVAVDDAYKTLLNSGLAAIPGSGNTGTTLAVSGTYTGDQQGVYNITVYSSAGSLRYQFDGLETGDGIVNAVPQPVGKLGLYIQFSSTNVPTYNTWTISIPNAQSATYVVNNNAYRAALQNQQAATDTAQNAVNSAQAALDLKQSKARPEDLAAAAAQLDASRAQYQLVQNSYSHSVLMAPIDGIITAVNAKVGQTVTGSTLAPGIPAIEMISAQKFQVETFVAETDIGKIKISDPAQVTLDAYGNNAVFPATVVSIDPAATVIKGVATYKVTLQFDAEDERIRTGMGANATITDKKHSGVLSIPQSSLLKDNGKTFVLVDSGQGSFKKTEIVAGIAGVAGEIEVLSGLNQGQKIINFGN